MSYRSTVLADSPVAYWRLGESAGTSAADETGNGHGGTYTGGFTLAQVGALGGSGDSNTAVALDGASGSYVNVPASAALNGLANYSLEAWVNPTDRLLQYVILSTFNIVLSIQNTGKVQLDHNHIGTAATSTTLVPTGSYTHLLVTYDGTTARIYINGNLDASGTIATSRTTSGASAIGRDSENNIRFFKGTIDEPAIYNTALSLAQVQAHYAAGTDPAPTVTTNPATDVVATSATLNGTVNPNGLDAQVTFQWGLTAAYGNTTAATDAGSGTSNVAQSAELTGLTPFTTYHYRVVATNGSGTSNGADRTFTASPPAILPRAAQTAQWEFILTDAGGNALAELSTASGITIAFKRNSYVEVNLTLSHEDDAASLLLSALANTGVPKLKGYRQGPNDPAGQAKTLRFRGPLTALQETSEETSLLTATFRSPFSVLIGDGDKTGRFVQGAFGAVYSATDAGAIAKSLIDLTNTNDGPSGLATDPTLIVATKARDRQYPQGQNIGSAVSDLTAVLDGFDFFETFVDGAGSTDAMFNVTPAQGAVNSSARFEYGPGTLSNVGHLDRTTQPPQNSIFVTGGNGLSSIYQDPASVAKYGPWWGKADFSTIIEQTTLDDKARGLCRPNPVKTVSFVPELGLDNCPKPFDDWGLGDTVTLFAARGALSENTQLRVNGFTVPISEDGLETVSVDNPTSPEEDAVIAASLIAEVVV